jgi:hypothetical protein
VCALRARSQRGAHRPNPVAFLSSGRNFDKDDRQRLSGKHAGQLNLANGWYYRISALPDEMPKAAKAIGKGNEYPDMRPGMMCRCVSKYWYKFDDAEEEELVVVVQFSSKRLGVPQLPNPMKELRRMKYKSKLIKGKEMVTAAFPLKSWYCTTIDTQRAPAPVPTRTASSFELTRSNRSEMADGRQSDWVELHMKWLWAFHQFSTAWGRCRFPPPAQGTTTQDLETAEGAIRIVELHGGVQPSVAKHFQHSAVRKGWPEHRTESAAASKGEGRKTRGTLGHPRHHRRIPWWIARHGLTGARRTPNTALAAPA